MSCSLTPQKHTGVKVVFQQTCHKVDLKEKQLFLTGPEGKPRTVSWDVLLGTDGAFSALRHAMLFTDRFDYTQHYIPHGYKELTIPPGAGGSFSMDKHALHIWPRGQYMLIALPNPDGSFTCTLFFPFDGQPSFSSLQTADQVEAFFTEQFPDALPLISRLREEYFENPTSSMVSVRCAPWAHDTACLLGDASHAIVPFYGQGMNAGFEDCRILNQMIDQYNDWAALFKDFGEQRKPDADAISELALNNFIEMRDRVNDPQFVLQKKIEARLHEQYPDLWLPLYSMVTFSHIPYSQALEMGKKQQQIMDKVLATPGIKDTWEQLDLAPIIAEWQQVST